MTTDTLDTHAALLSSRLRALRKERDLNRDDLRRELEKRYGITVSADSLGSYERCGDRAKHPRACMGMRTELLMVLADFYGVSADWLLGLSEERNVVTQCGNREICPFYKEGDKGWSST